MARRRQVLAILLLTIVLCFTLPGHVTAAAEELADHEVEPYGGGEEDDGNYVEWDMEGGQWDMDDGDDDEPYEVEFDEEMLRAELERLGLRPEDVQFEYEEVEGDTDSDDDADDDEEHEEL